MKAKKEQSRLSVMVAAGANLGIAVMKFIAAGATGSASMLSEGVHSVVDTGNEVLLMIGLCRSGIAADKAHPFGYGKEIYFWSLLVAMMIFIIGGGISFAQGLDHIRHPHAIESFGWAYAVLGVSFLMEGTSFLVSYRALGDEKLTPGLIAGVQESKDPSIFTVLIEDGAALIGILLAAAGLGATQLSGNSRFDGAASCLIGLLLASMAIVLANECRNLLIGESLDAKASNEIYNIAQANPNIERVLEIRSMHLGPREVLLNMRLMLRGSLDADTLANTLNELETKIRETHPEVKRVFIDPETLRSRGMETETAPETPPEERAS